MRLTTLSRAAIAALLFLAIPALFAVQLPPPVFETTTTGIIDWSALVVRSDVSVPHARLDADAPAQRTRAFNTARQASLDALTKTLLRLPLDGTTRVGDLLQGEEPDLADAFQNLVPQTALVALPFHVSGRTARMGLGIRLAGRDGLLSLVTNFYPLYELPPAPRAQIRASFHHSGLIIDARHLPFRPALGTRVFNAAGELVYGIVHTDRTVFVEQNHVLFASDPSDPRVTARVGSRFMLTVAKAVQGPLKTDLVLFDVDSDRLLASSVTRDHMRRCRVVVLCNSLHTD